jgi:hypothetical protein
MASQTLSAAPVPRRTRDAQRRIFAVLNPIMRFLLRFPWRTPMQERLLLLMFTGRKSGRQYTVPISFAEAADGSLLVPGGGAWKWNLGEGRRVQLLLRGRLRHADSELISDPAEVEQLLPVMVASNPRAESFIGVPIEADGRPNAALLAAALHDGFVVVRLRLIDAA